MKIKSYDLFTKKDEILTAIITTDHPASSYGQPVMLIDEWENGLMDCQNWILGGCYVVEMDESENALFQKWRENLLFFLPSGPFQSTLNPESWQAGYDAGLQGLPKSCPENMDHLSWLSGYIEGKAKGGK